jgi:hypothetical protein
MGRYDRKHPAAVKAAVVYAVEELGLTAKQVAALAAAGELRAARSPNRLEAFKIADSTVKNYVHLARRRGRRAQQNGAADREQPPDTAIPPDLADPEPEPKPGGLLDRLVKQENEYERAHAEGLECECPEPDPSVYLLTHGRICHGCNRPTTATPINAR